MYFISVNCGQNKVNWCFLQYLFVSLKTDRSGFHWNESRMGVGAGLGVTAWPIMLTCALLRKASSLLRSDPMWAQSVCY